MLIKVIANCSIQLANYNFVNAGTPAAIAGMRHS